MAKTKKVKWDNSITNIQSVILEGLARYKFLTISQMMELEGIGTTQKNYLWRQASSLRDRGRPLVVSHSFGGPEPKRGKVEDMYYLTKYGKKMLIEELRYEERIKMPVGATMAYKDYHHRKRQIDFQIWLDKWVRSQGLYIPFFDCYFDKTGNNRVAKNLKAKTAIRLSEVDQIIPDGVFEIQAGIDRNRLFLFEMYNDKNTARIVRQLQKHVQAMVFKSTHAKYNIDPKKAYYVVLLFNFPTIMEAVIERIKNEEIFRHTHMHFICASIDQLRNDKFFKNGWKTVRGDALPFLTLI